MRVAIDLDGVLADWDNSFAQLLQILTGRGFAREANWPHVWDWPEAAGYSQDEIRKAWEFIRENPDWWFYLPPTSDAITCLDRGTLHRLFYDHEVFVVTSREAARSHSEAWLQAHLGIPIGVIDIKGPKGPLFDALQVDVAIDDKPDHLLSATKVPQLFLVERSHNELWAADSRLQRLSLVDILDILVPAAGTRMVTSLGDGQSFE